MARHPLTTVTEAVPLRSVRLFDPDTWLRGVDPNAKSAGNTERFQHQATTTHHQEVVSRGGHLKPSYDLLTAVRIRRHQWLGYILRMPSDCGMRCWRWLGQRAGPPYKGSFKCYVTLMAVGGVKFSRKKRYEGVSFNII